MESLPKFVVGAALVHLLGWCPCLVLGMAPVGDTKMSSKLDEERTRPNPPPIWKQMNNPTQ